MFLFITVQNKAKGKTQFILEQWHLCWYFVPRVQLEYLEAQASCIITVTSNANRTKRKGKKMKKIELSRYSNA